MKPLFIFVSFLVIQSSAIANEITDKLNAILDIRSMERNDSSMYTVSALCVSSDESDNRAFDGDRGYVSGPVRSRMYYEFNTPNINSCRLRVKRNQIPQLEGGCSCTTLGGMKQINGKVKSYNVARSTNYIDQTTEDLEVNLNRWLQLAKTPAEKQKVQACQNSLKIPNSISLDNSDKITYSAEYKLEEAKDAGAAERYTRFYLMRLHDGSENSELKSRITQCFTAINRNPSPLEVRTLQQGQVAN